MGENKNGLLFLFYSILFNKNFLIWFHLKQYAVDILTLYYIDYKAFHTTLLYEEMLSYKQTFV